jgi:hypothetical protein
MRRAGSATTLVLLLLLAMPALAAQGPEAARIREAALRIYVHGMTAAIAKAEAGADAVPVLHELLVEPGFPRRDNVVAFLAYLGGSDSTPHLLDLLSGGALDPVLPADERAALVVPEALARIAERGDERALRALLALTRRDPTDPALPPNVTIDANLARQAVRALAFTGATSALARLAEIERSLSRAGHVDADLASAVRAANAILEPSPSPATATLSSAAATYPQDPNTAIHEAKISWVNHVDLALPVDGAEGSELLRVAARILGTAIDASDVACCATLVASGSAGTFGVPGDGFDIVDTDAELTTVLADTAARVKVVLAINSCGGPGTNIVGCSPRPGNGMVVVRLNSYAYDASLWAHEYGHNVGLPHRIDPLALMYPYLNLGERISQAECAAFHAPPAATQMTLANRGTCGKDDDSLAAQFDNCPGVTNEDQLDWDGDGLGDACETGLLLLDADRSGFIDGFDLARLGRSFGASMGNPRYDPSVDFDRGGLVDGDDLSRLAAAFGSKVSP